MYSVGHSPWPYGWGYSGQASYPKQLVVVETVDVVSVAEVPVTAVRVVVRVFVVVVVAAATVRFVAIALSTSELSRTTPGNDTLPSKSPCTPIAERPCHSRFTILRSFRSASPACFARSRASAAAFSALRSRSCARRNSLAAS